ncbi:phospholipase D-like domain-containing protein [Stakelama pacifica]|uniref:Phospholipase D n=1 Tax=Stakelama pacifica TaxID=517720 RepID=A0A4V3BSZ6_9SPHN|nr:phospholipase D-like domain-containing protein [Stakelama pacifica]TDN80668.1 phosphatidylserine/phosphatidylglycerophosphate/cardiolipin synthase-like enzyme [Stakelama pacifica]GGO97492.1 phospholipase D/transphosphatidylase [Stakelama pacifica]
MVAPAPVLEPGRNCWRIETASAANVIIDADDYFRICREAMKDAEHQILLIGWDFDARIKLVHEHEDEAPGEVGAFIDWLVARKPNLHVNILRWDTGALKSFVRGRTMVTLARWWWHKQIHLKLDRFHPTGASHHQKIVVIDDCLAFCGGIDMTDDRWDTRSHRDDEPNRVEPGGTVYGPWHDATTALTGPVAKALGELCRDRWARAGGKPLAIPKATEPRWPEALPKAFENCEVAISRSFPAMTGQEPVREIEQLYLDLIARAERWIYAESQYFASRKIAEAIAKRLEEPDGPEIVIINPVQADGWLEQEAMDSARAQLLDALEKRDPHGRLGVFHAETAGGQPIYIHAKVTVIDGEILRVGSSNFNNRSLRLDTECDVTIDSTRRANAGCTDAIAHVAYDLLAEHLGSEAELIRATHAETGSLLETIERHAGTGRRLRRYRRPDINAIEGWMADNEILDPEGPEEMFEPVSKRGLFRRLRRR